MLPWFKTKTTANSGSQKNAQAHASLLMQDLTVPAFVLGADGRVLIWNKACEDMTGWPARNVVGTLEHWRGFYRTNRPCLADLVFNGAETMASSLYETSGKHHMHARGMTAENWCDLPKGRRAYLAIDANPVYGDYGQLVAVIETLRDITTEQAARANLETERREQALRHDSILSLLGDGLNRLASGDLTVRLTTPLHLEAEKLRHDFNAAADKLRSTMATILKHSQAIGIRMRDVAQDSDDLVMRWQSQAAMLEEGAAALEQATSASTNAAAGVGKTRQTVSKAAEEADAMKAVLNHTVDAICGIESSSRQISQFVDLIDEIAFQTNILSLNAAVEAARAGDAGRGFAVVADEMRALAQRSSLSAKETRNLVVNSCRHVTEGTKLVAQTSQSVERMLNQVIDIDDLFGKIAVGSHAQAQALNETIQSMRRLDRITLQNTSMIESRTAATRQLLEDTEHLVHLIGKFKVVPETGKTPAQKRV